MIIYNPAYIIAEHFGHYGVCDRCWAWVEKSWVKKP